MTDLTTGILGGLGAGFTWATSSLLVRSLCGSIRPVAINAARCLVAGCMLLVVAVATGHGGEIAHMPLWVVLSLWVSILIALVAGDTLFFASVERLGVTRALTLGIANPLLTTIVGVGFLGEEVTLARVAGICLVVGGLVLVVRGKEGLGSHLEARSLRLGLRLGALAAVAWSVSALIIKAPLREVSALTATAVRLPLGGIVFLLTPWARGAFRALRKSGPRERRQFLTLCVLTALGPWFYCVGIKYAGVAVGTVLAATAPLFSLPLEFYFLGQRPSRWTLFGALVAIAGIALLKL